MVDLDSCADRQADKNMIYWGHKQGLTFKLTGGMKNDTHEIITNMAEGRYTDSMKGPSDRDRLISNPYTE